MNNREKYRNMSLEERIELIEQLFVKHPSFERCLNKIEECHQHSKIAAEPLCLLITGESGVGKTTLCKKYIERYPRIDLTEKTKVPVLLARIPVPATPKNLVTVLLAELGDPLSDKGTTFSKTKRLFKLLKECEVELIILDEFQHFIDRDSDKVLNTISDWLKQLINESKLPIVLVGLPQSIEILDENSQLRRRFAMSDELTNFDWVGNSNPENSNKNENNKSNTNKEKKGDKSFRTFLKLLDETLPLAEDSNLASKAIGQPLYKATDGNAARTMKLIRYSARLALKKGKEKITLLLLEESYEILFTGGSSKNPFTS